MSISFVRLMQLGLPFASLPYVTYVQIKVYTRIQHLTNGRNTILRTSLIRFSGLVVFIGAFFQCMVMIPGTIVSYWTINRGFAQDPTQALGIAKYWTPTAAQLLQPLLFFTDPQVVYHMYDGLWMIPVPCLLAGLVGLFHARPEKGRLERAGFVVASLGLTMLLIGNGSEAWFSSLDWFGITDFVFIFLALPGLLLTLLGATFLGAGLLRSRTSSRMAAWLLIFGGFPGGAIAGLFVVGHLFGFLFLYDIAWMILGIRLWTMQRHEQRGVLSDLQVAPR